MVTDDEMVPRGRIGGSSSAPVGTRSARPDALDELTDAVEGLISANRSLRMQLERNERILRQGLTMIERGVTVVDTLQVVPSLPERRAAEDAVTELFDARHRLRRAVVYAALKDGLSPERIAHMMEVSVHLVCALAAESPYLDDCPGGDGPEAVRECLAGGCRQLVRCPRCPHTP